MKTLIRLYISCDELYGVSQYEGDPAESIPGGYEIQYYDEDTLRKHLKYADLPPPNEDVIPFHTQFDLDKYRDEYPTGWVERQNSLTLKRIQTMINRYESEFEINKDLGQKELLQQRHERYKKLEDFFIAWFIETGNSDYLETEKIIPLQKKHLRKRKRKVKPETFDFMERIRDPNYQITPEDEELKNKQSFGPSVSKYINRYREKYDGVYEYLRGTPQMNYSKFLDMLNCPEQHFNYIKNSFIQYKSQHKIKGKSITFDDQQKKVIIVEK